MSEYTPTITEVRGSYVVHNFRDCHSRPGEAEHQSVNQFGAEFDRWLAAHDAELREQIAQEIESERGAGNAFRDATLDRAAAIARGEWS